MVLRLLTLLVLGFIALSALHGDSAEGVRLCGRRLADLLNLICEKHGGFHAPRAKRDVPDKSASKRAIIEILRPLSRRTLSGEGISEVDMTAGFRSGVVDECCRKQCTISTLVSYCANSRHVGNIDLEEILPPGTENVPAISAEDLAEYQLQHESKGKPESAEANAILSRPMPHSGLAHSSRPNLGQFMRSRPVFIVVSQLQEDEDRALGDYRF